MSDLNFSREDADGQLIDLKQAEAKVTAAIEKAGEERTFSESSGSSGPSSSSGSKFLKSSTSDEGIMIGNGKSAVANGVSVFLTAYSEMGRSAQSSFFPGGAMRGGKGYSHEPLVPMTYAEKKEAAKKSARAAGKKGKAAGKHEDLVTGAAISGKSLTDFPPKGAKLDAATISRLGIVPQQLSNSLNNIQESKNTPSSLRLQDGLAKGDNNAEEYVRANRNNENVKAALN